MTISKPFLIAEVAQSHDGSLGILHSYIDAVASTGIDAIKFQTHIADAESSHSEPFRVPFSYVDSTRQDYWRRMEFSLEQWVSIKQHCEAVGLEFVSTPSCVAAFDLLEKLNVRRYKIGSGDIDNFLLLHRVSTTNKQVLLSSGLSSFDDIDKAVSFLSNRSTPFALFQCTSQYPVESHNIGLNVITDFRSRYSCPIGLSDHSSSIYPSVAAVALGVEFIEVHITFDRAMFGPDSSSSITIKELAELKEAVDLVYTSLSSGYSKDPSPVLSNTRSMFGKSLSVNQDLSAGSIIELHHLESKKPSGCGIPASEFSSILGKTLTKPLSKWDFITSTCFT